MKLVMEHNGTERIILSGSDKMVEPTPTHDSLPRRFADFATLPDAVDYAAKGVRGLNFYSARGQLDAVLTYRELRERAIEFARRLMAMGLEREARVALIADTSPDFVVAFIGCQYASLLPVPLPLPTSFGGREGYCQQLNGQMRSCDANVAIAPAAMLDLLEEATAGLKLQFCGSHDTFNALPTTIGGEPAPLRLPNPDDLAYLQYSSGSTRFPHGVAVTHKALMANTHGIGYDGVHSNDNDRCVSWLPFYHDMGLVGCLLATLTCQMSTDYLATEDFARRPLQWLNLMSRNRGTISYSPTFGYEICARRISKDVLANLDLSAWRVAGIGGDMIRPDVMDKFAAALAPAGFSEKAFVASYGLAECTLAVSFAKLDTGIEVDLVDERVLSGDMKPKQNGKKHSLNGVNGFLAAVSSNDNVAYRAVVNCGTLIPGYELEIRDEYGNVLGDREIGRVFVRGPSVMREYYRDPEATAAALSPDGWLDTGDMGYVLKGSLYIVGRFKDMMIINGRNHWPQDIEWAVEQIPGVRTGDTAAISIPGSDAEEVPLVLVQCRLRDEEERLALRRQIKDTVQQFLGINCEVMLVSPRALPKTSSGKLSRSKARLDFLAGTLAAQ
jgi:fatty-acyl-CoA synthase